MKPVTLTFDKCVFRGLTLDVHRRLAKKYRIVASPALNHELASDLEIGKDLRSRQAPPDHVATMMKRFLGDYTRLAQWSELCERELVTGEVIPMDGTPVVENSVGGFDEASGKRLRIQVRDGTRSIDPWENFGRMAETGAAPMHQPRTNVPFTRAEVLGAIDQAVPHLKLPKGPQSEAEVVLAVDAVLDDPALCRDMIRWSVDSFGAPEAFRIGLRLDVQKKWRTRGRPPLSRFAPYTRHCARVMLMYFVGYEIWPKPREPNDRRDLEYLRYLPFCDVFATDDKFTKAMARHLIDPVKQRLVTTDELRAECGERADSAITPQIEPST